VSELGRLVQIVALKWWLRIYAKGLSGWGRVHLYFIFTDSHKALSGQTTFSFRLSTSAAGEPA
jgi:hypothetical protein